MSDNAEREITGLNLEVKQLTTKIEELHNENRDRKSEIHFLQCRIDAMTETINEVFNLLHVVKEKQDMKEKQEREDAHSMDSDLAEALEDRDRDWDLSREVLFALRSEGLSN